MESGEDDKLTMKFNVMKDDKEREMGSYIRRKRTHKVILLKEILKWMDFGKKKLEELLEKEEEKRKQVEEEEEEKMKQVREYNGSCLSAVSESCLKNIMLWTGFLAFFSTSFPIAMRGGEKLNWPPVEVVRVVLMFHEVAFVGSLLGLLMGRKSPKLSFYSGYVSLFSLLLAFCMIAFFTVM